MVKNSAVTGTSANSHPRHLGRGGVFGKIKLGNWDRVLKYNPGNLGQGLVKNNWLSQKSFKSSCYSIPLMIDLSIWCIFINGLPRNYTSWTTGQNWQNPSNLPSTSKRQKTGEKGGFAAPKALRKFFEYFFLNFLGNLLIQLQ